MTFSRRQLLRDTAVAAALIGFPAMIDSAVNSADAASPKGQKSRDKFIHPGILHTKADIAFMRDQIKHGREPWKTAWEKFTADTMVVLDTAPGAVANVFRGPYNKPDIGSTALGHDSGAAYAHALFGAISPDRAQSEAHYRKAVELLDAWSGILKSIDGHDQKLLCGLTGYRFCNAAELLLYTDNVPQGIWPDEKVAAFKAMMNGVFLPPIRNLFPEANGNWDAAMLSTLFSIAIVCDDHPLFDHAVDLYLNSGGNGAVTNYVYPSGQIEETTRDQGHVQMGIGLLATACRIAWSQGVDLYSAADNRLALGFEYTAKYNLGEDVPCDSGVPGAGGRGKLAPIYESIYQHYAVEKGLPMPYTRRVIEQKRPEGYDGAHASWGTLTACRKSELPTPSGDLLAAALAAALPPNNGEREITVSSPSGNLTATVGVRGGKFTYALKDKAGHDLLRPSTAGIAFDNAVPTLGDSLSLWDISAARREIIRPRLFGENGDSAPNLPFEQRIFILRENAAPHRVLRVEFRVYDTGIAFQLTLPPNRDAGTAAKNATEQTAFVFPDGATVYESYENEDEFRPVAVSALKPGNWLPFTVQPGAKDGPFLSILEVDDTNAGMPQTLLSPLAATPNTVITDARGPVPVGTEVSTNFPWRIVLVGDNPAKLAENNRLIPTFWPAMAPTVTDTAWIKPGKAIREVTLTTPGAMTCIDFTATHGLKYILFDAGWYGPEASETSDARQVSPDRARVAPGHPGLDMQQVIAYGKGKGIGVFLYVNRRAAERQMAELAPLYESWGVAGIKLGFVNVGPVEWTRWMRDTVALCAKHHLMVDIHDAYRPVGLSGTYPNLLTQEGIRGNEHMPTPRHNCTVPFTRFLSGPADYTICYRFPRLQTTDAHQMALSVLYYGPFTMLYWYGQPKQYDGLPEVDFFTALSTVWDETRWLGGEIGEWAAVARRSGQDWFVGAITNESARTVTLPLDFLGKGAYTVRSYTDKPGPNGAFNPEIEPGVSRITIEKKTVRHGATPLKIPLLPAGGVALWLTPS